ncbi:ribosome small subunit-dependent GTPase A [Aeromicrobium sp. CnD17-E]|uniref:ribosome small subunit-dependent GTPase A n=1 Tax=Aeromicrobium sp. CnD17-E TaxID=2954487 RepID=UPI00209711B1|nr:ribosome small subunit-dependent GTPase A [Aeromicrobium sp. CnD17-E]MCO7240528.1 ribosome small subunit-dependent GTPase A [Aeromicrobium sp. CnD17-E]
MRQDDEHAGFDRPRRRTRPRTKDRPSYDDAPVARVVTIDRGRYTLRLLDTTPEEPLVTAMKSRPLGRQGVVVGDEVRVVGDVSGDTGTLARIVEVLPRRTVLRRTADDDDPIERVVVANADQLVVVTALADPPPRPGLIDRCLVAAFEAGMEPLVCLTKSDLGSADPILDLLRPLDVRAVVTRRGADGLENLDELREAIAGRVSVFIGHSGVGKSTLVNALVPGTGRAVSHVNEVTGRGRHTSTSALAIELDDATTGGRGGWIIDTPGFRSFGLAHVEVDDVLRAFPDLDDASRDCPRGCTHAATEPECALDLAVAAGTVPAARVESFRRIVAAKDTTSW